MTVTRGLVAAALASLAAVGLVVSTQGRASATPDSSTGVARATRAFVEHADTDQVVDLAPVGDSRGDQLAFANPVYDAADRRVVGSDLGSCVRTEPRVSWQCSWTLTVPGGELMVQGPFYDAKDSVLAITGGTGVYARARGEMTLHALDGTGAEYRFTYRIQP